MTGLGVMRYARLGLRGLQNIILKRPLSISFEVTHDCSANCEHCNWGGKVQETHLSPAEYGEICRELKPVIAHLSGGEPMLRRDICDIAAAMSNPNGVPIVQIVTHGAKLTVKKYEELRKAGIDRFCISLDFPDERLDEWRHLPGLFNKLNTNLPEIAAFKREDILVNCCITGANALVLPDIVKTATSWGIGVNFSAYTSLRTNDPKFLVSDDDLANGLRRSIEEVISLKRSGYKVLTSKRILWSYYNFLVNGETPKCQAGYRFLVVNPDGRFTPCAMVKKYFRSQKQMVREFSRNNTCLECYICTRADTEKTVRDLLMDNLGYFRRKY
jgi:MoaA/NifB/PqqE/SkfB family radical SAM enzyme